MSNLLSRLRHPALPTALAAALLTACATPLPVRAPVVVPAALQPTNERAAFTLGAVGVQIYECKTAPDKAVPSWAFVAPQAELMDAAGAKAGTHGAGPFWQAADGSRVVGSVKARADAPAAGAIPWLLLAVRGEGAAGRFTPVTSIQRINTAGGVAPAQGCAGVADLGQRAQVPYTADYVFFVAG
jgi:hypothetical protein